MSTEGFMKLKVDAALFVSVQRARQDGSLSTIVTLPVELEDCSASLITVSWDSQGTIQITS